MKSIKSSIIVALFAVIAAAAPSFAAVPEAVTYAGELRQGNQPADGTFSAFFRIFDAPTGGAKVFEQDEPTLAVSAGELVVDLGTDPSNTLSQETLAGGNLFLEITLNGEILAPRVPFTSVPFARRAELAESAEQADVADQCNDSDLLNGQTDVQLLARVSAGKGLVKSGEGLAVAAAGITSVELAAGSVSTSEIEDRSITTGDIGLRQVTLANMASNSVSSVELVDGAVKGVDIADHTISATKALNGVDVFEMPEGCGGAMVSLGSQPSDLHCFTQVCRIDSLGISNFLDCGGGCPSGTSTKLQPARCAISTARVGTLLK